MNHPILFVIILLRLLAAAANLTQVFEWPDGLDFKWPSEVNRAQALEAGTFKPENIEPRYMAVFGKRIFLSLEKNHKNIPVSLVTLPTSSASSTSPKLTPFPSVDMHEDGNCEKIQSASGLQMDATGKLWVLDSGCNKCNSRIWTFDLTNYDHMKLIHQFSFQKMMDDLVIDETSNGTFAFIAVRGGQNIVVFSLEKRRSWIVDTPGLHVFSFALSPKEEPRRQLYISKYISTELYSISVAALRNGIQTANPKLIGRWTAVPIIMQMDNHGTLYATFWWKNYILSWNTSQPFEEQRFLQVRELTTSRPFIFVLDSLGNFWMIELNKTATNPKVRLLKAVAGAKPFIFEALPEPSAAESVSVCEETSTPEMHQYRLLIIILICTNGLSVVFLTSLIILWLILRQKRNNSLPQNTNEAQQMSVFPDESAEYHEVQDENSRSAAAATPSVPAEYDYVSPVEGLYEEVKYGQIVATPPAPSLYERPICLSPELSKRVRAMPERPRTFEDFGEAPRPPVEDDAQPEPLYDDVAPTTPTTPSCGDTTFESAQYLQILP